MPGFPGLPAADPRNPALALFVQALGGGTSSRLFQELREERGLAYSVYAWSHSFADTGLVGIGCAAERRRRRSRSSWRGTCSAQRPRALPKPSSTEPEPKSKRVC